MDYLYLLDLIGTSVFAISGILLAHRYKMDLFGMLVLATVTAIGGGTIRDMALGATPVFWAQHPVYLYIIFATCLCATLILHFSAYQSGARLILIVDAIGLAAFTAIGVNKALLFNASPVAAIVMGVLTGVGGGMIRDVLAREVPMVLQKEVYATACIAGGSVHAIGVAFGLPTSLALWAGAAITLSIRLAAIHWNLHLPTLGSFFKAKK
ncbi:MAG: trimeric intracellular cation channel family protein [Saezia sp.]